MQKNHDTFLALVANRILSDQPGNMHDACVVVPNKRAGLYLKHYLSSGLNKPAFAPSILAIEDFVFSLLKVKQADQLLLLWELYDCYSELTGIEAQSFEEFLKWGRILLQDFEDIDMHLADASNVFGYLSEAKALELWNPGKGFLTSGQQRYLSFYRSLAALYQAYVTRLMNNGSVYKGLAFRLLTSTIKEAIGTRRWSRFYFAGFNALTPAEQRIIEELTLVKEVVRLYDADSYYLDDPMQEAGIYLRSALRNYRQGNFEWVHNYLCHSNKTITIIGVPHDAAQALVAGSLLSEIKRDLIDDTAVVLNEEKLLLPLLNNLPADLDHFNVTMGYPFLLTPAYGLLETILQLYQHAYERIRKTNPDKSADQKLRFYFRDVFAVLKHSYISAYLAKCFSNGGNPLPSILSQGRVFYTREEILLPFNANQAAVDLLQDVFTPRQNAEDTVANLIRITQLLAEALSDSDVGTFSRMDHEFLYHLSLLLNRLGLLTAKACDRLGLRGLHQLIRSVAGLANIPFSGEPLKGVQIMGMLETRALDFKNVIMLSVSEGILPAGKTQHSFIPYDIRRNYNLPVYSERDAVFAYHFYRLLQRCENLFLVYNTTPGELGGGEKSRFILQLEHELTKANPNIRISEKLYSPPATTDHLSKEISVAKTSEVMDALTGLANKGLSPSALGTYVACPLKFYFSYVMGIDEESTIDDSMDAAVFGTGIHNALHGLYKPFEGKILSTKMIDNIYSEVSDVLRKSFLEAFNNNEIDYGRNLLMVKVAESYLKRFCRFEKETVEAFEECGKHLQVLHLEYPLGRNAVISIHVDAAGQRIPVRLKGKADRIDSAGGRIKIIDYKSGAVYRKELKIEEWSQLISDPVKNKALQLLTYAYLYAKEFLAQIPECGIISFRNLSEGFMEVALPEDDHPVDAVESIIAQLLSEIYDESQPFTQTAELKTCEYCPFAGVCQR